jgi:hypothetical protein
MFPFLSQVPASKAVSKRIFENVMDDDIEVIELENDLKVSKTSKPKIVKKSATTKVVLPKITLPSIPPEVEKAKQSCIQELRTLRNSVSLFF